jgi:hypothetical protein
VYALGYTGGLTSDQLAARHRLEAFSKELGRLGTGLGPGSRVRAYRPSSLSVFAEPSFGQPTPASAHKRWPLHAFRPLPQGQFQCVGVVGAFNVARVLRLAAKARANTVWFSAGRRWHLIFRPDLPGTKPCRYNR